MLDWETVFATRSKRMRASEIRELLKLLERPDIISFAGGIPDPALFPHDEFQTAYKDIFGGPEANAALQYSVSEGYKPLRTWLVSELAKIGIPCTEDNVFITSGSQQALDYLGKLFISPNDTALVTAPTYLGALQAFNAYEPTYDILSLNGNRTPDSISSMQKMLAVRLSLRIFRQISAIQPVRPLILQAVRSLWPMLMSLIFQLSKMLPISICVTMAKPLRRSCRSTLRVMVAISKDPHRLLRFILQDAGAGSARWLRGCLAVGDPQAGPDEAGG